MILSLAFLCVSYGTVKYSNNSMRCLRIIIPALILFCECSKPQKESPLVHTCCRRNQPGSTFTNTLKYTEQLNPYTFKNFFNGGGVAIGDLNNDGLSEIFFCGNMVSNKLYLNLRQSKVPGYYLRSGSGLLKVAGVPE